MLEQLYQQIDEQYDEMIDMRRYLHMHPEVSFKEYKTAEYIADFYQKLGISPKTNVGGNGIIATIEGSKPGKTVAIRADFDALPIQDAKDDVSYQSTVPGVMHACGHDGHTTVLLTLAKIMNNMKEELQGTYVFIHQHAEELIPGGAKSMVEAGCLEGVDAIFGTHLWSTEEAHAIGYRTGPIAAAADRFEITIQGKGGHGAQPHNSRDAIVAASQLVVNIQQIVSRRVNPLDSAVVSIGNFAANNEFNVIADSAKLAGTVRTFREEVRESVQEELERIIKGTCLSSNVTYDFHYIKGYPAVVNHEAETDFLAEVAKEVPGVSSVTELEPKMVGEDFSYYLQKVPGTFFFTGAAKGDPNDSYPHHHPKFNFNEEAMLTAAKTLGAAAIRYQTK
ncbi:M20 family metallopeptidase [Bacillus tianshenii]|nr:M20 family metallopeptidase [Bacillus tianshenii]